MRDFASAMYERASSFGRDVFLYIASGTVFVLVCLICTVPLCRWIPLDSAEFAKWESTVTDAGVQLAALFVAAIVLFCLGHLLFCVGFWIRNKIILPCNSCWDKAWHCVLTCLCCCRSELEKNKSARQKVDDTICRFDCSHLTIDDMRDVHVVLEMVVFEKRRQLHANYVERYNTLWHLRLGLAASLLCAGVIGLAIGFSLGNCSVLTVCVAVGAILGGLVLMHQHLVTNTNFLHRIVVAFKIVQQEEQQPDGQRQ